MTHDFQWETVVTGLLAVGAAIATIRQTSAHERNRLRREANAARVTLPLVLSGITDWSISLGRGLMDLMLKANSDGHVSHSARSGFARPATPVAHVEELKSAIKATDDEAIIKRISKMVAKMQVLAARLDGMMDRSLVVHESDVAAHVVDAAIIHAQAASLFRYGRRKAESTDPNQIEWGAVRTGLSMFGCYTCPPSAPMRQIPGSC